MSQPVFVTAAFHARTDQVEGMKSLLHEIVTQTLAGEPGCVSYTYLQSLEDETFFTSFEIWKDAEAEAAHWKTDHLQKALEKLPPLLSGQPTITKWHRI